MRFLTTELSEMLQSNKHTAIRIFCDDGLFKSSHMREINKYTQEYSVEKP